jgi:hypothetical protein
MANEIERKGHCLCGAVRLTVTASVGFGACHCRMCRRWSGGPLLAVECSGAVQFDGGEDIAVFSSSDWAERGFCRRCGSHLFYRLKKPEHYAVPVGLFADEEQWSFEEQIFVDEKPAYYEFANRTKNMTGEEAFAQFSASGE